ncbi:MAG TPA: thiamine pyrophosphate-binding protein [Pirellulales bacterium]|nr:thiamine pyrophosphate-binding protein [Pirellulales bacterium]
MLRLADYLAQTVAAHGVKHVFLVTGGGAMHLNDAFGRCKDLQCVCCHHEQTCAMAAEAYARTSGKLALVNVTTGPGGINAINGVFGAWVDSIPMVIVSGQVRRETTLGRHGLVGKLRQLGDQEADIISMVRGITKYAVSVDDPQSIRYHLERALHLATAGRPGPCWIDVPMDVQGSTIDPDSLPAYDPAEDAVCWETKNLPATCSEIIKRLRAAERPVIYAGSGVRLSGAYNDFLEVIDRLGVPVVTAWNSNDLLWNDHPLFVGRPGTLGDRAGNFAVQNADVLLVLGSRLNIRQVSYNWENFARAAYKIAVDIDAEEMRKPTVKFDMPVHADLRDVLRIMRSKLPVQEVEPSSWLEWCHERQDKYPVVLPQYWENEKNVNPYCFMDALFARLEANEIIACGDGTACVSAFQAATIRPGQRLFHNSGCASMGYDLPAAIGATYAFPGQRIVCIAGDGSIMMNLQELQTIAGYRLPVKIFVLNNCGYHSIRQTQRGYFPDNIVGCGTESGLTFPNFAKLAEAFGLEYVRCENHSQLSQAIPQTLAAAGPSLCEVMLDLDQPFAPRVSSRRLENGQLVTMPLEDMAPFMSREELAANMIVPMAKACA